MYIIAAVHIVVLLLVAVFSYMAMLYVQRTNSLRLTMGELYDRINSMSGCREEIGRRLKSLYGNMGRRGLIAHVSDNIEYSGVGIRLSGLTPELYILIMVVTSAGFSVAVMAISGKVYAGICSAAIPWALSEAVFSLLRNYRYRREEEQLLALVNSIEGSAAESDDIIYIFEKAVSMVDGPIHDELGRAVAMVKSGIQGTIALGQLENRIEHSFFKTLIRNLEVSSRNNANYREITAQCRGLLAEQLENTKKMEGIYREARIRLMVILLCAMVCLEIMARTMLGMSLRAMFVMFSKSIIGCCLIGMIAMSLMFTVYFIVAKGGHGRVR